MSSSGTPKTSSFSLAVVYARRLLLSSFLLSTRTCSRDRFLGEELLAHLEQPQVVLPLHVGGLKVVLGRGQVGAEEIDERISFLDFLTQLGPDFFDERVKSRADLGERVGIVVGASHQGQIDRLDLWLDRVQQEPDRLGVVGLDPDEAIPGIAAARPRSVATPRPARPWSGRNV